MKRAVVVALGILLATPALADDSSVMPIDSTFLKEQGVIEDRTTGIDASIKVGGGTGTVSRSGRSVNEADLTYKFGGVLIAPAVNQHFSRRLSLCYQYEILLDMINSQVARQGLAMDVSMHILGGARRTEQDFKQVHLLQRNSYNLSLVGNFAFQRYAASTKDGTAPSLSGSTFEVLAGMEYRQDISDSYAVGMEALSTVFSMPGSVERITSKVLLVNLFLRMFI